jgi:hypothetical protein
MSGIGDTGQKKLSRSCGKSRRRQRMANRPLSDPIDKGYEICISVAHGICDLERRRIATLLPDRGIAIVQAGLSSHSRGDGATAARALTATIGVADRWHLMEGAARLASSGAASMRTIRRAIGATKIIANCNLNLQSEPADGRRKAAPWGGRLTALPHLKE